MREFVSFFYFSSSTIESPLLLPNNSYPISSKVSLFYQFFFSLYILVSFIIFFFLFESLKLKKKKNRLFSIFNTEILSILSLCFFVLITGNYFFFFFLAMEMRASFFFYNVLNVWLLKLWKLQELVVKKSIKRCWEILLPEFLCKFLQSIMFVFNFVDLFF